MIFALRGREVLADLGQALSLVLGELDPILLRDEPQDLPEDDDFFGLVIHRAYAALAAAAVARWRVDAPVGQLRVVGLASVLRFEPPASATVGCAGVR